MHFKCTKCTVYCILYSGQEGQVTLYVVVVKLYCDNLSSAVLHTLLSTQAAADTG